MLLAKRRVSALLLNADGIISIEGTPVQINGRVVLPGKKPSEETPCRSETSKTSA